MPSHKLLVALLVGHMAFGLSVYAQTTSREADRWSDWNNLSQLEFRQKIRVDTMQPKRKLKARFVCHDNSGITIELSDGSSEIIAKTNVRRLLAEREAKKATILAGAAAGGIVFAALVAGEEDLVPLGKAMFVGIGAGIGALGGWGVSAMSKTKLIYEAPKR
ncbi:MAG: hypothetical protein ACK5AZ_26135 [Bryobacteraceae bacterium]